MATKRKLSSEDYRAKLQIDRNALDDAIQEHPGLLLEVHEAYIAAASIRDAAKAAVDETYATVGSKLRKLAEKRDEKTTEGRIKEEIATDPKYQAAIIEYQEAKTEADLMQAMVAAFSERGKMLAKLADLYISGYWSSAATRGSERDMRDRKAAEARESMRDSRRPSIRV